MAADGPSDRPPSGPRPGGTGLRRPAASGEVVGPRRGAPRPEHIDEGPSEADLERLNSATQTCPECGKEVFADTELCYHCGAAIMARPSQRVPLWAVVTAGGLVVAFVALFVLKVI